MAPRHHPTIRQRRFGAELRRLRDGAGMSAPTAAERLGVDRTMISNIESGRFGISEERLRRLTSIYECGDPELVDALAAMTGGRARGWWDEYRGKIPPDFLDVAELEHHATALRTLQTAHVPGLFQTEEHARALFDLFVPALPRIEVELRVAQRMARHSVIERAPAVPYVGLVHEAALRMRTGGRHVALAQLRYLLEESERPNVRLLVIPFAAEGFPMAGDTVLYASAANTHLDTVEVDSPIGAVFFDSPTQLANFRRRLDLAEGVALNPKRSRDLIRTIVENL
ncbi:MULTISPECIES: helix-turn-helix domain-containing protein [Streptomyces]|uniref:XRE family transcriptional regulator n=2 Tax=Streptomyces TaxID=1883 RepID=A0A3R7IWZ0_9ACTN|nr:MULTISPECIES: helix-turn-helix transcriptional regulator [Streptomyces]KNE81888.1 DNA-binding protein [Streptomyces fradiae]OFA61449.1 transcriptional regulator [Streptomyces fradiae]PQM24416.1 XRE family transcriptional regulator [Streptomyces xinghaiensis]RKM98084.1 XRE family transcriptional regulator [Streptomyces xinghaiensis]RNC75221.1 XRE family transcriptional regulator [Streptomyces xinghaiensis]